MGGGVYLSATHQTFKIPTGAMRPALVNGDHIFARKVGRDFQPQVGDMMPVFPVVS